MSNRYHTYDTTKTSNDKRTQPTSSASEHNVLHPSQDSTIDDWPSLASTSNSRRQQQQQSVTKHNQQVTDHGSTATNVVVVVDTDDTPALSEDIGPRTRHRRPKAKPAVPFKVLKARAAAEEDDDESSDDSIRLAPITVLPSEILARIFAHLDARSIVQCTAVCHAFATVARDEATWRLAFSLAFGIEAQQTPILRRVDASSWKQEYTQRSDLLRRWRKARSATVLCDARIGPIHSIALSSPHNFMLCASLTHGVASRCDPFTGKVAKGFLDASGQINAVGLAALVTEQGSLDISALCLEADATRIVWGFHTGAIGMTSLARQGTNPRGAIRGIHFSSRASHIGPVLDIAMPFGTGSGGAHSIERSPERIRQRQAVLGEAAETFVTCGMDGSVRLWSPRKAFPLWTGIARQSKDVIGMASRPVPVVRLAYHVESGTIVVATINGDRTMWTNIDIDGLIGLHTSAFEEPTELGTTPASAASRKALQVILEQIRQIELPATSNDGSPAPSFMTLDVGQAGTTHSPTFKQARLLTLCTGARSFDRLTIDLEEDSMPSEVGSTVFPLPYEDEITCLRPDFDLTRTAPRLAPSVGITFTKSASSSGTVATPPNDVTGRAPLFTERKFVCAGTKQGRLVVWDWDQNASNEDGDHVRAWTCLDAHHAPITAIDLTEHVVSVGCADGTVKAFCPLSGQLIRTFNDRTATRHPARMLAAGQLTDEEASRFNVSQVIVGRDTVVACIGSQVLAWRAEIVRVKGSAGRKGTSRTGRHAVASGGMGRLWDPRMQSMKEMERDVYETRQELQKEHEERVADRQRLGSRLASDGDLDGLTEQEAFEYAMMLSLDEMQTEKSKDHFSRGMKTDASTAELDDAIIRTARAESSMDAIHIGSGRASSAEDEDLDHDDDEHAHEKDKGRGATYSSHSPSPSPLSSPYIAGLSSPPSRAWDILQNAGSMASRNTRVGDAHSKVQAIHVPRTARLSSFSLRENSYGSQQPPPPSSLLESPHDWPSFDNTATSSLAGRSPSRLDLGSPVPYARHPAAASPSPSGTAVNQVSQMSFVAEHAASPPALLSSSSSSARGSPMGAWAYGSPSLRPLNSSNKRSGGSSNVMGTSPSALSSSRPASAMVSGRATESDVGVAGASPGRSAVNLPASHNRPSHTSNNDLDDDLRFVIELSLAEERSRQEQEQRQRKGKWPAATID